MANVSVLNVFKTSVDTINASSITSDMTIGANLNGGSLTLGNINSVTNITSGTINASNFKLYSTQLGANQSFWIDSIGGTLNQEIVLGYNNASHIYVGGPKTTYLVIGGDKGIVNIANNGLVAGARVNIASGTNAANTEMYLGSNSLTKCYLRASDVNILGAVNIGSKTSGTSGITKLLSNQTTIGGTNNWPFAVCSVTALNETLRDGIAIYATQNGMAFVVFINMEGAACGSIGNNGSGTGVLYSTTSDRRLKTNIKPMNNMLDNIMKMKPSNYNWVSNPEVESQGFIAQEIFEIFPEMRIKGFNSDDNIDEPCDENGNPNYYSLDYGKFTPYIIKAMQEMKQDYDKQLQDMKLNYEKRLSNIEELLNIT